MISIILENNLNVLSRKSFCIVLGHLQAMQYVKSNLKISKLGNLMPELTRAVSVDTGTRVRTCSSFSVHFCPSQNDTGRAI